MRVRVRFYRTDTGRDVVREELDALDTTPRAAVTSALRRRSKGKHQSREDEHVKGPIYAVRATVQRQEFRLFYATLGEGSQIFLALHAFEKKSRKLPKRVIKLAEKRLADWERRHEAKKKERERRGKYRR